MPIYEQIGLFV